MFRKGGLAEDEPPRVAVRAADADVALALAGCRVRPTEPGALDRLELDHVDVGLIDLRALAPADEEEVARLASRLPLLLIVDSPEDEARATRLGAAEVIRRPLARDMLQRRLAVLTEIRRTRRALAVTDAALAHSVNGMAIADARVEGAPLVYVSPTFETMTGYRADEVLGDNCRFLQGADTDPAARARIKAALAGGGPLRTVLKNYRKDGTPFWNELTLFPIHDDEGRPLYVGGLQHDVTELVEARAEIARVKDQLAQRHAFTHAILDGLHVSVVTTDDERRVTYVNRAAAATLGVDAAACLGRDVATVLQLPPEASQALRPSAAGFDRLEWTYQPPEGPPRELGLSIRAAEAEQPEGLGWFLVFRDLAETRQAERLERLAAVSTMAAGFAHEVRNPLATLRMLLESLESELASGSPQAELAARMHKQIVRIERLVRTSLRFARPERARKAAHWPSVILNTVLEALTPRCRSLGGELDLDVAADLPRLVCDDGQLVQVLVILVNNALDATGDPRRVMLRVRAEDDGARGPRVVRFSVEDDGPGIPDHLRAKIFHPFFTTRSSGTGLGLSIAQQIVHENGGRIELARRDEPGAHFSVVLPAETP